MQNIMYLLRPGDHILLSNDCYGGTYRLVAKILANYGIEYSLADLSDLAQVKAGIRANTKLVWVETPTNPYLRIVDIRGVADLLLDHPAKLVVDNTFASPYLQQPLNQGADLVVHSTTKYLGGHSDVVGGAVVGNDPAIYELFKFNQNAGGAVPGPFDCWLTLRGIKTLGVRMDRHCSNAAAVAEFLQTSDAVKAVYYPGLASHPGHAIAARQMRGFSGMVSFTTRGGAEVARDLVSRTKVFQLAESLGGVESLVELPNEMTHASVAGTSAEVEPNLIRLSVGIEHISDLLADLKQAIAAVSTASVAAR